MNTATNKATEAKTAELLAAGWGGVVIVTDAERLANMRATKGPAFVDESARLAWTIELCPPSDGEGNEFFRMAARMGRFGRTK